jgi:glycine/D-amino acid oxidase-like deaminating enzyme
LNGQVDGEEFAASHRQLLLERLNNMMPTIGIDRWNLEQHRAAVRPASYDRHPLIGRHRWVSNAYTLNGLGSKGSLMAPLLAEQVCDCIETGQSVDPLLDWQRRDKTL